MIPLTIRPHPDPRFGYRCTTDESHSLLAAWLERDVGRGGGVETDLFEEMSRVMSGKPHATVTGDEFSVRLEAGVAKIASMHGGKSLSLSFEEIEDAVMRWFKVVDPAIASDLLAITRQRSEATGGTP